MFSISWGWCLPFLSPTYAVSGRWCFQLCLPTWAVPMQDQLHYGIGHMGPPPHGPDQACSLETPSSLAPTSTWTSSSLFTCTAHHMGVPCIYVFIGKRAVDLQLKSLLVMTYFTGQGHTQLDPLVICRRGKRNIMNRWMCYCNNKHRLLLPWTWLLHMGLLSWNSNTRNLLY